MMRAFYETLYRPGLELQFVGIALGVWLIVSHAIALLQYDRLKPWLKQFPRNYNLGLFLIAAAFIWTFMVWTEMDLGEFWKMERPGQLILIVGGLLVAHYVRDFLAVRASGFLLILLASPILTAAFLEPPRSRLLVVVIAYAMVLVGMFWVGKPYLMRDQIDWVTAEKKRWQIACGAGVGYGIVVLLCALLFWGVKAAPAAI